MEYTPIDQSPVKMKLVFCIFFFAVYEEGVVPFYLLDFLVKSVRNKESVSQFETCAIFVVEAIVSIISITKNK